MYNTAMKLSNYTGLGKNGPNYEKARDMQKDY